MSSGTLPVVTRCRCAIAPPSLLLTVAEQGDAETRDAALRTLLMSVALRSRRSSFGPTLRRFGLSPADLDFLPAQAPDTGPENTVYDVAGGEEQALPGRLVRGTTDPPTGDAAVDEAFDGAAATADFYREEFDRDSVDGRGLTSSRPSTSGSATTTRSGPATRWSTATAGAGCSCRAG